MHSESICWILILQTEPINIVLTGGGFGHGIGMSQYGADAMGKEGKKWQEILGFYFKDVTFTNVFDLDT